MKLPSTKENFFNNDYLYYKIIKKHGQFSEKVERGRTLYVCYMLIV